MGTTFINFFKWDQHAFASYILSDFQSTNSSIKDFERHEIHISEDPYMYSNDQNNIKRKGYKGFH